MYPPPPTSHPKARALPRSRPRTASLPLPRSVQSEPKNALLSPVLSASELVDDAPSGGKRQIGRGGVGGGGGGKAPSSGTAFADRSGPGAGGGPAGGRGGGGGGPVGEVKSAMYEAFKQVGWDKSLSVDGAR